MYYRFSKYVKLIYYKKLNKCYIYSSFTKTEIIIVNNSVNFVLKLVKGIFVNDRKELNFCEKLFQLGFLTQKDENECKFTEIYNDNSLSKIQIELTKMCNLKCKQCYINEAYIKDLNNCFFDLERCKSLIDSCIFRII